MTDTVDARPKGKSPYALYGMKGDVFTWLADWYDASYYGKAEASGSDPKGPASSPTGDKCMRGLGYSDAMEPAWRRWKYDPKAVTSTIGVRCAY
ncbi:MAG: SUMF1/EgtB/PvdO family nonheme iron enzyme [Deltaproteobacteria bacterium]|nr:SUMF1/EgtB/PvdO family nonheme iron enzyme [Deltaproteobacteria bacterium]